MVASDWRAATWIIVVSTKIPGVGQELQAKTPLVMIDVITAAATVYIQVGTNDGILIGQHLANADTQVAFTGTLVL